MKLLYAEYPNKDENLTSFTNTLASLKDGDFIQAVYLPLRDESFLSTQGIVPCEIETPALEYLRARLRATQGLNFLDYFNDSSLYFNYLYLNCYILLRKDTDRIYAQFGVAGPDTGTHPDYIEKTVILDINTDFTYTLERNIQTSYEQAVHVFRHTLGVMKKVKTAF